MLILEKYEQLVGNTPLSIALGSFDGVHLGHRKLIDILLKKSKQHNTKSAVYTFSNHPRRILLPGQPLYQITDIEQRAEIMEQLGIDILFQEDFTNVMGISAENFVKDILVDKFKVKSVVVGYNYRFGFKGEGDAETLKYYGAIYGFDVEIVPAVIINGHAVSSSLIRHTIRSGNVEIVPEYLGRVHSIRGIVEKGKQNGVKIGFPTANLVYDKSFTIPHRGIYSTSTKVGDKIYKSVTNIGDNPTFEGEKLMIETHILDFDNNIYSNKIEVFFLNRIRDEIKFENVELLIAQIKKDIEFRRQQ